jgi:hypothetical protein
MQIPQLPSFFYRKRNRSSRMWQVLCLCLFVYVRARGGVRVWVCTSAWGLKLHACNCTPATCCTPATLHACNLPVHEALSCTPATARLQPASRLQRCTPATCCTPATARLQLAARLQRCTPATCNLPYLTYMHMYIYVCVCVCIYDIHTHIHSFYSNFAYLVA